LIESTSKERIAQEAFALREAYYSDKMGRTKDRAKQSAFRSLLRRALKYQLWRAFSALKDTHRKMRAMRVAGRVIRGLTRTGPISRILYAWRQNLAAGVMWNLANRSHEFELSSQAFRTLIETALRARLFLTHVDLRAGVEEWKRCCYGRVAGLWALGPYRLLRAFRRWAFDVVSIRDWGIRNALEMATKQTTRNHSGAWLARSMRRQLAGVQRRCLVQWRQAREEEAWANELFAIEFSLEAEARSAHQSSSLRAMRHALKEYRRGLIHLTIGKWVDAMREETYNEAHRRLDKAMFSAQVESCLH